MASTMRFDNWQTTDGTSIATTNASGDITFAGAVAGAGKILQVVSTIKTDVFSSTSTSFVTITGLSVTITPSATSSKILVVANVKGTGLYATAGASAMFRLARDGTAIAIGDADGSTTRATGSLSNRSVSPDILMADTAVTLDSPATTSAVTYTVEGANPASATTWYVNRNESLTNAAYNIRAASTITVMEVSA